MIKCKLAVCADTIVRDTQTDLISVFNIAEVVNSVSCPINLHRIACLFVLTREEDDTSQCDALFTVKMNEDHLIPKTALKVDFSLSGLISRQIISLKGLVIHKPGIVRFSISVDDNEIGYYELPFGVIPSPQLTLPVIGNGDFVKSPAEVTLPKEPSDSKPSDNLK